MKAAVLEEIGKPLAIREVNLKGVLFLNDGYRLLRMINAGICGSQIQEIDGKKGDPSHCPHLLGHEGCGKDYFSGRKCVVHWRKGEGEDPKPFIWDNRSFMNPYGPMSGGYIGEEIKAGPCTTFSEHTVVSENRVTEIDDDVPNDFACLLGCCLSTALAIVENEADVANTKTAFVIGCGGLGLALILALKAFGVPKVVATDLNHKKQYLVRELGAEFIINQAGGFDLVIDTTGQYQHLASGRYISLQKGGTEAGGFNPTRDIPKYVQMWRDGKLNDYTKLITHRIKLEDINKGIELMRQGRAGRVLIEFDQGCQHIPKCFEKIDDCWNWDESRKRTDKFPNYP